MSDLSKITSIQDLQALAKKRVPKVFYDYVDSGSWTESTYRNNQSAFQRLKFRQRVGINLENRNTSSTILGERCAMPVAIAPTGLAGMQRADGEILAARAALNYGIPYTLSTLSICSLEAVSAGVGGKPFWFQLYVMKDKDFVGRLIDRAKAVNCSALVVTLDLQVIGQRHKDIKNNLTIPIRPSLNNVVNLLSKVNWWMGILRTRNRQLGNIVGHINQANGVDKLSQWINSQFDLALNWHDLAWIKQRWGGKLIVKGILDPEDALLAVKFGADAIIVSNHGGRQLDGAPASLSVLPHIVEAVGDKVEIHLDSGIRSGQDVLKALALGAKACHIGRAHLFGLGAAGEAGVRKALEIIHKELDISMGFCGRRQIHNIGKDILWNHRSAD